VSEQVGENEACVAEHGVSPVELLRSHGVLGPRTTLVHATHLTADDIDVIAESGSTVCFCPTTEADLGDGIGPAVELVEAGVSICLGSDSNAVIDILHEANRLEQHDRLRLMRRGIHPSEGLAAMATANGMRSLGWPDRGLDVGCPADFIAVDTSGSELARTGGSLAAVMSSATRASVTDVVVGGVIRKQGH
jgi:cytosine/adenosine deaminase-related metal-dependent hydrolase